VLVSCVWVEDFYRLWVGDKYLAGEPFASVATLLQIMLVGTVTGYAANIASQILIGTGRIREVAILKVSGATITTILSVILMPYFGLHAIPIALVIGISIVELIGVPIVLNRNTGLNFLEFMRSSSARLVVVSLMLAASFVGIKLLWIALPPNDNSSS